MNSTKSAASSRRTTDSFSAGGARASATCEELRLAGIAFEGNALHARFTNGGEVVVDVKRYPRLQKATAAQRGDWRLIGKGLGVHWEALDEDLSVENLLFAGAKD